MAEVVNVVENVDLLFSEIEVNGETYTSSRYVAEETSQGTSTASSQEGETETEQEQEATSGTGEDVYAVELNDVLHNFVDRALSEKVPDPPSNSGTYALKADVAGGSTRYSWGNAVDIDQNYDGTSRNAQSGIAVKQAVDVVQASVSDIEALIPNQATSSNQLADKDFVNSSIATNTANFLGTYTSLSDIEAIQDPTNNDYAFLQTSDQSGNVEYQRYKYSDTTSSWQYEYTLNNSSFTSEQWATINSGLTQSSVENQIEDSIDQNYDSTSAKAQSGIAMKQAIDSIGIWVES